MFTTVINNLMKKLICLFSILLLIACKEDARVNDPAKISSEIETDHSKDISKGIGVAEKFINDYVANCNRMKEAVPVLEWIMARHDASEEFKQAAKKLVEEAYEADPELGLGYDPVFDGQDYDDSGYSAEGGDPSKIIVRGKTESGFIVPMSVEKTNGNWMVTMCGAINPKL